MAPKVWAYCRVSTIRQVVEGNSLEAQELAIAARFREKYGRSEYVFGGVVRDEGVSGRVPFLQRKGGAVVNTHLEEGDVIIFSKLDRGFRNLRDLLETAELWRARGVKLECLDLGLDTGTPVGRMVLAILASVAEFERERMIERVREGWERSKANGGRFGCLPRGKKLTKDKKVKDDEWWLKRMYRIYQLRNNGYDFIDIAHAMDRAKLHNWHNAKQCYWSAEAVENTYKRYISILAEKGQFSEDPTPATPKE